MVNYPRFFIFFISILVSYDIHALSSDIKLLSDISYGKNSTQTLDVYIPPNVNNAPVIFMVHGGGWRGGDKARTAEFENKVAHWVTKGFIFISTNYRTLPEKGPIGQAEDVSASLLFSQQNISKWGGSSEKFILMGHSSGAHIISMVSSNYKALLESGMTPWLGTVSMDISYDFVKRMEALSPSDSDRKIFGSTNSEWRAVSPYHILETKIPSFLAICSIRSDIACDQARHFIKNLGNFGTFGDVLAVDLSHGEINSELGKDSCYTFNVDQFLQRLDPDVASILALVNRNEKQPECVTY